MAPTIESENMKNKLSLQYLKNITNPWKFFLGMLMKLPSVIFWGIRVAYLDFTRCDVTIPYSWRTQNPFRSIYFAAMAGAGELATGALCQLHLADRGRWSMLVVDLNAKFYKKADETITFSCEQGDELKELLDEIEQSGVPKTMQMEAIGRRKDGLKVARIMITWSFKKKS